MKKRLFLPLLAAALLSSCKNNSADECSFYAMDTYITLKAYGAGAAQANEEAQKKIKELSSELDPYVEGSAIYDLNLYEKAEISGEIAELINASVKLCARTNGAFDITVFPLKRLWGFDTGVLYIPSAQEIAQAQSLIGSDRILISESGQIELGEGQKIDPGAVAKGYACDVVKKIYADRGVESAILSLGGNVMAIGAKPDKSSWSVGISDPEGGTDFLCVLSVTDKCVVTSGNYRRYLTDDEGRRYGHIIDPDSGRPAESDIVSATVICESGTVADALSTAVFVMGSEKAIDFYKESDDIDIILYLSDGRLLASEGIAGQISATKTDIQTIKH